MSVLIKGSCQATQAVHHCTQLGCNQADAFASQARDPQMVCFYNIDIRLIFTYASLHAYKSFVHACFGVAYALDAGLKSLSSLTSASPVNAFKMDAHGGA